VYSLPGGLGEASLPFVGFVEAVAVQAFRRTGTVLPRIRLIATALRVELGVAHPLASSRLLAPGVLDHLEELGPIHVARPIPRDRPVDRLRSVTYGPDGYAARIELPQYRPTRVVADPTIAFGQPIVAGNGTRVVDVVHRFRAGDDLRAIVCDFELADDVVDAIIRAPWHR
jgi:uncharacterized protein (DUF433 family)